MIRFTIPRNGIASLGGCILTLTFGLLVGCSGNLFQDPVSFDSGEPSDVEPVDGSAKDSDSPRDTARQPDGDTEAHDTSPPPEDTTASSEDTCTPASRETFCQRQGAECGTITATDRCGNSRQADCGSCEGESTCGQVSPNKCTCPCEIDGGCQSAGETSPDSPCKVCDPAHSTTSYSDADDGTSCGTNRVCQDGKCGCAPGHRECGGTCVDISKNPDHCGSCGNACASKEKCSSGRCTVDCPAGETGCNGSCVDTNTNNDHCGACGNACTGCETCSSGSCVDQDSQCSADGWYDTGSNYSCCDGGRACTCIDREYRDFSCNQGSCEYTVTDTRTESSNCTPCGDGNACTADSCSNGTCTNTSYCSGTDTDCGCQSCTNCDSKDGWYQTGGTFTCCDGDSVCSSCQDEEYRDYSCSGTSCDYTVTQTRTSKSSCSVCKDKGWIDDGPSYNCCGDTTTLCSDCQDQNYQSGTCSSGACTQTVTQSRTTYNLCSTCTQNGNTCTCSSARCTSLCMH